MLNSRLNLVGLVLQGSIQSDLTEIEVDEFCEEIKRTFSIKATSRLEYGVVYKLESGVNSMRWVDGAEISIITRDKKTDIRYAISTTISTIFLLLFSTGWLLNDLRINAVSPDTFIPFFITLPVLIVTSLTAKMIFKFRIVRAIKRITLNRIDIPSEQQQWMTDPDRCPACGHQSGAEAKCPACGLTLIEK